MLNRRSLLLAGLAVLLGPAVASYAADPPPGPAYQIVLRSRHAEVTPHRAKDAQTGGGSIVAVSSDAGVWPEVPIGAYSVSKRSLNMLAQMLAMETGRDGIRVNAIGPGFTATPLNADARQNPDYMANFTGRIPLGRIGSPDDIAQPAVFLASDMARYITGVTLAVDGGYLAR